MTELEKIDSIRERFGISYKDAKEALDQNNGDVLETLIYLEEHSSDWEENIRDQSNKIYARVKALIKQGNVTKIKIKKNNKTVMEIPATMGALGALVALAWTPLTIAVGVGTVAAAYNRYTLEFEKDTGEKVEEEFEI